MALTLGPSTNRDLLLPLPSLPPTPTALPECCAHDPDQPTNVQPDEPPTQSQLRRLENYPLYDSSGHQHSFSSLFSPSCLRKQRLLVIFIRNFFCGNCQQYLLTISQQLPPSLLPSDVAVAVIGCGAPSLLPSYMELTHCPYPLYTDPSAQLYQKLGMKRSWSLGSIAPHYIQQNLFLGGLKSIAQGLKRLPSGDVTKAGEMDQNGGEFLFKRTGDQGFWTDDWEVDWCHRMRNTRDHTEVSQLKQILDLQESLRFTLKEAQTWAPRMTKERHGKRWNKRSLSSITAVDFAKEEAAPKTHSHKRSTTLTQSLSQKGHTVMRTLTLKRPGTAGSWVKDAETQKRSLTPAVAMPDLTSGTSPPRRQSQSQPQPQANVPSRSQSYSHPPPNTTQTRPNHLRTSSRSKSTAQILSLKVQTLGSKKVSDDGVSESHVALVQVVSPASAVSFRSLTPQIGSQMGSPAVGTGTPLLGAGVGAGGVGGMGAHGYGHGYGHGHGHGHGLGNFVEVR